MTFRFGIGHWYFGKADRVYDPASNIERFRTTVFAMVFFFPLFPTGTYVLQVRNRRGFFSGEIGVVEKLPLDWGQAIKVWLVAISALLVLLWILQRI